MVGLYISGHPLDQFRFEIDNFCNASLGALKNIADRLGQELTFGGIVTDVAHRTTKTGKPFGVLTLEDYSESHAFYLFSDDYIRLKEYLVKDWFLYIKGQIVQKKWGDMAPEFKIGDIKMLAEVREKFSKGVLLTVRPEQIDEDWVEEMERIAGEFPGKCSLKMNLVDEQEKINVELLSRKYMINPDNEFFKKIRSISHLDVKIQT